MPYLGSGLAKFVLTLWRYCPSVLRECSREGKWVTPLGWVTLLFPDPFHKKKQRIFFFLISPSPSVLVEFTGIWCRSFLLPWGGMFSLRTQCVFVRDFLVLNGWRGAMQPPEMLFSTLLVNGKACHPHSQLVRWSLRWSTLHPAAIVPFILAGLFVSISSWHQ